MASARDSQNQPPAQGFLDRILTPDFKAEFLENALDRRPFAFRAADETIGSQLFGLQAFREILTERDIAYPLFYVARDGKTLPPSQYTESRVTTDRHPPILAPAVRAVDRLFRDGALVSLQHLERNWAPIRSACSSLWDELLRPVEAAAFIVQNHPAQRPPFPLHADDVDVLALQLVGHRRWVVRSTAASAGEDQLTEYTLKPGDLLYIPKGWPHEVAASESLSLHLSFIMRPVDWRQLINSVLSLADGEAGWLDEVVPRAVLQQGMRVDELHRRLNELATPTVLERAVRRLSRSPEAAEL